MLADDPRPRRLEWDELPAVLGQLEHKHACLRPADRGHRLRAGGADARSDLTSVGELRRVDLPWPDLLGIAVGPGTLLKIHRDDWRGAEYATYDDSAYFRLTLSLVGTELLIGSADMFATDYEEDPTLANQADSAQRAEPLRVIAAPVEIDAFDADAPRDLVVRLFFQPGDHGQAPHVDIAEVVVLETADRVSIGLVRRGVDGEWPRFVLHGESLRRRSPVALDVPLDEPLGTRTLIDAWTGATVRRVERSNGPLPAEIAGTPLWHRFL